ncbi:modification methylase [Candidatus Roizmanbacteria bacterium RIFOXYA1_FULL_41_12]|uniref:Modification methylase n=1 Tax=Candidatus Roizmanbacteria bacterium RIFOXYA1_FULL_41_12 TaxID=1802082 RepID=A0A1F7KF42_9BACT|nr:MAG: modification methylase [Candidatus Roizmanbacteria bacterium RIFOXYA1_FULL_41_12]OGK71969.1 MAG: modification methylase [Candidatus Roizmanbacteria bacterium RIFOXYC1_FULL_41_16]OGK75376.1 MAG: modification methylase [Candidatus Roizmanbacteria bacterium RIFOXYD1_FULL_41_24]
MAAKFLNTNLHKASAAKKDEFYTQLVDIEKELKHYKEQFQGKVVYCNCDDPYESNFFKYFASNFNALGLKKLIATSYSGSPIIGGQLPLFQVAGSKGKQPLKIEIKEVPDTDKDGAINLDDVKYLLKHDKNTVTPLKGSGDFRSDECIELLKQADIVVTNPPFSLFRDYVAQLVKYKKKFLIMGNQNAITYKEIFKLIKENKLWLGQSLNGKNILFQIPDHYESYYKIIDGKKYAFPKGVVWFTNLNVPKRNEELVLYRKYSKEEYSNFDNYNAINVDRTEQIPMDYKGVMGVPITFLHKYNPDQFEIIGLGISTSGLEIGVMPYKPEHKKYRKEVQKRGAVDGDLYMIKNEIVEVPYARILIKNKK